MSESNPEINQLVMFKIRLIHLNVNIAGENTQQSKNRSRRQTLPHQQEPETRFQK